MAKRRPKWDYEQHEKRDWRLPKYRRLSNPSIEKLTDADIAELRQDFLDAAEHNRPIAHRVAEQYQVAKKAIIALFGENSKQYKYWDKTGTYELPVPYYANYDARKIETFEDWVRRNVIEPREKNQREEILKRKDAAKHNSEIEKAKKVTVIALRHGVEDGEGGDVYDALIEKDKYLSLGIDLLRCRNDFSEWKSARNAISNFKIETPQDVEISADLHETIEDWDGDGRIFRDCEWGYDRLFALVDKQLYDDVMWLRETFDIY